MEISAKSELAENTPNDYGECYWCAKELKKPVEDLKGLRFCSPKCISESNRYGHFGQKGAYITSGFVLGHRLGMAFLGFVWFIVAYTAWPLCIVSVLWVSLIHPIRLFLKENYRLPHIVELLYLGAATGIAIWIVWMISRLVRTAMSIMANRWLLPEYQGNNLWLRFKNDWANFWYWNEKRWDQNDWQ